MHRPTLGVIAALLAVGGVLAMAVDLGEGHVVWGGMLLRSGVVLGAIWLVLPSARRIPAAGWVAIAIFSAVLVFRPRLVVWGLLASVVVAMGALVSRDRA